MSISLARVTGESREMLVASTTALPRPPHVVTALGETVRAAQTAAYHAVDKIDWPGGFCRRDIGWRAVVRG